MQQPRALGRRRPAPVAVERGARGLDGAVDVGLVADRDLGQRFAGRGLDELLQLAAGGLRLGSPLMKSRYSRSVATAMEETLAKVRRSELLGQQPLEAHWIAVDEIAAEVVAVRVRAHV